jgi:hypothetical protein
MVTTEANESENLGTIKDLGHIKIVVDAVISKVRQCPVNIADKTAYCIVKILDNLRDIYGAAENAETRAALDELIK